MCGCISVFNSYVLIVHFYIVFECGRSWISRGLFLTIEHSVWICHSSVKHRKCVRFGSEYRTVGGGGQKITSFFSRTKQKLKPTAIESKDSDDIWKADAEQVHPAQARSAWKSISHVKKRKARVKVNVDMWRASRTKARQAQCWIQIRSFTILRLLRGGKVCIFGKRNICQGKWY